jgi:hypothetical protein
VGWELRASSFHRSWQRPNYPGRRRNGRTSKSPGPARGAWHIDPGGDAH